MGRDDAFILTLNISNLFLNVVVLSNTECLTAAITDFWPLDSDRASSLAYKQQSDLLLFNTVIACLFSFPPTPLSDM